MSLYYVFNSNVVQKACNYKSTTTFSIAGKNYTVVGNVNNVAQINISPIIQSLFGMDDKIGNTKFSASKPFLLDGEQHTAKYGYKAIGETDWGVKAREATAGENELTLRYLDHFGNWQYWTFIVGAKGVTDGENGESLNTIIDSNYISRPQIKYSVETINLCSPLVTEADFKFLCDIKKSINVCAKIDGIWIPVQVSTGSNTWEREKRLHLQNFEITITKPKGEISL